MLPERRGLRAATDIGEGIRLPRGSPPRWPKQLPRGPELWEPSRTRWTDDNTDGLFTCDLIQAYLRLTKGPFAGQLVTLRMWQGDLICDMLRLDTDGSRVYWTYMVLLSRKNSKSLMGGGLAIDGLLDEPGAEVYCLDPATNVLCDDLVWRPIGAVQVGDGLVAFDEQPSEGRYRKLRSAHVTSTARIHQEAFRVTFEDGRQVVASATHRWLGRGYQTSNTLQWMETQALAPDARLRDLGRPWVTDESRGAGYLAGIFDGEGCIVGGNGGNYRRGSVVSFAQKPGVVLDVAVALLKERGFSVSTRPQASGNGVVEAKVTGLYESLRLIGSLQPHRLVAKVPRWLEGQTPNRTGWATVTNVEPLGKREVVAMGTSTGTLFAEGIFSHNSCAADKDQAKIIFAEVRKAVEASPDLDAKQGGLFKVYRDAIEYPSTSSVYKALSAEAFTKEGLNPSRVLFDELHAQPNWELWNVMNQGSDTRANPLIVAISTFGVMTDITGGTSVCKAQHDYVEKVMSGEVEDPHFGARIYATNPRRRGFDYRDPRNWGGANPALGDFLFLDKMMAACRKMPEADFKTKRLNIWVQSATPWLPDGAWAKCEDRERFIPDHARVVLSFDGSRSGDCTGIVVVSVEERPQVNVVDLWEKQLGEQNWRVPRAEVKDRLRVACRRWDVVEIAWDEYLWLDAAEELEEEGLPVVVFPQTMQRMGPATQRFYELTIDQGLTHDGDPRMTRHVGNAVLKRDARGSRITKAKPDSPLKIDLGVCAVMGVDRAAWHLRNSEQEVAPWSMYI